MQYYRCSNGHIFCSRSTPSSCYEMGCTSRLFEEVSAPSASPSQSGAPSQAPLRRSVSQAGAPLPQPAASGKSYSKTAMGILAGVLLVTCLAGGGFIAWQNRDPLISQVKKVAGLDAGAKRAASEVVIPIVWVMKGPQDKTENYPDAKGGVTMTKITVSPNTSGHNSVGVPEEHLAATGNQIRAAVWLSAFKACQTVGRPFADYEFLLHTSGYADGPSAGMLMSVAMLAAIRGDTIRNDTTITGAINPDGTIGPVGGIPHKLEGAAKHPLKRFGYPISNQMDKNLRDGEMVSLQKWAKDYQIEAKPLRNIEEAYEFLTDKKLPSESPASEMDMQLPLTLNERVAQLANQLNTELQQMDLQIGPKFVKVKSLEPATGGSLEAEERKKMLQKELDQSYAAAVEAFQSGERNARDNAHVAAVYNFMAAKVNLRVAKTIAELSEAVLQMDTKALVNRANLDRDIAQRKWKTFHQQALHGVGRESIGGLVSTLAALHRDAYAQSGLDIAEENTKKFNQIASQLKEQKADKAKIIKDMVECVKEIVIGYIDTDAKVDVSTSLLSVDMADIGPLKNPGPVIERSASDYASAAEAVWNYFDELVIKPKFAAKEEAAGGSEEEITVTEEWRTVKKLASNPDGVRASLPVGKVEKEAVRLGYATYAYLKTSWYVNANYTNYSDSALQSQLEFSRLRVLQAAGVCKRKLGSIPGVVQMEFQMGERLRNSPKLRERHDALEYYWRASFLANFATSVAGDKSDSTPSL